MTKVVGCLNCGYRTTDPKEIQQFKNEGCSCIKTGDNK